MTTKYVWLDIDSGKFSNSWDEKMHEYAALSESDLSHAKKNNMKLIKYEVLNDDSFEFMNQMKLR